MPNKVYTNTETDIYFGSGTAPTVEFSPEGLPIGSGQISTSKDLGAFPHSSIYRWIAQTSVAGTGSLNGAVEMYLATSPDNSRFDGGLTANNSMIGNSNVKKNLHWMGSIGVQTVGSGALYVTSGIVEIYNRYVSLVWFNQSQAKLWPVSGVHQLILTPIPDEIQ